MINIASMRAALLAIPFTIASISTAQAASVLSGTILSDGATAEISDIGAPDEFEISVLGTVTAGTNVPFMASGSDLDIFAAFDAITGDLIFADLVIGSGTGDLTAFGLSAVFDLTTSSLEIEFDVLSLVSGEIIGNSMTATVSLVGPVSFPTVPTVADVLGDYTVNVVLEFEVPGVDGVIPLPATLPLLIGGLGLMGIAGTRRRS